MIHGNKLLQNVREICDCGPRFMGSQGAAKAVKLLLKRFQNLGLEARAEPFDYLGYEPRKATASANGLALPCEPMAYSATTSSPVSGRLVYAGQCGKAELDALEAKGVDFAKSIVLSDNLRSFVAYPQAAARGAAGFILATSMPPQLQDDSIRCGGCTIDASPGGIPGLFISGPNSRELVANLELGTSVDVILEHQAETTPATGHNLVARIPGRSGRKVLVSAHYDSMWNGVHAMDNAAGCAMVLELAATLPERFSDNFEFVIFGAEEVGLKGSEAHCAAAGHETRLMINHDTLGSVHSGLEIGCTEDLRPRCEQIMAAAGLQVDAWNTPPREASDQVHFVRAGTPAVWIANAGKDPFYHTPRDVPECMSEERLEMSARASLALFEALCGE